MKKLNCILLIDDNPHTNIFNKKLIQKIGLTDQVFVAENGKQGMDFLTNQGRFTDNGKNYPKPDLIFLDINMPVMDGWDFLKQYQKLTPEQKGKILIIMLTTSPNPDDEEKARSIQEVTGFKRKPVTMTMLKEITEEFFLD